MKWVQVRGYLHTNYCVFDINTEMKEVVLIFIVSPCILFKLVVLVQLDAPLLFCKFFCKMYK
jgi:hypothetical protein